METARCDPMDCRCAASTAFAGALTHPFRYPRGAVASRSLLPLWQTQGGHDGTDNQRGEKPKRG